MVSVSFPAAATGSRFAVTSKIRFSNAVNFYSGCTESGVCSLLGASKIESVGFRVLFACRMALLTFTVGELLTSTELNWLPRSSEDGLALLVEYSVVVYLGLEFLKAPATKFTILSGCFSGIWGS